MLWRVNHLYPTDAAAPDDDVLQGSNPRLIFLCSMEESKINRKRNQLRLPNWNIQVIGYTIVFPLYVYI